MEVIKHGNTYREKECPGCGALLSYGKADIKKNNRSEEIFGGDWHYSYRQYIICPECKEEISLSWIVDGEERVK